MDNSVDKTQIFQNYPLENFGQNIAKFPEFSINTRKQPHHKWRGFFLGLTICSVRSSKNKTEK